MDPFDISDPSDIEELMAQKPKKKEAKKEVKKEAKKEAKKDKKTEEKKPKPILKPSKTSKRKADDDSDADSAPAKKKSALSKGILDKMAQDDAEIALLEKRLKMKGKKIPKAFEDDGLDFLLEGLDQDYLDDRKEKAAKKNKADKKAAKKYEESEDSEDDEDDGLDDLMDGLGDDSELDGSDEGSDEGSDDGEEGSGSDDGEFGGFSDDDAEEKPEAPAPRVRENPYKPGVTITEDTTAPEASVAKYIPPSLRKAASTDSERIIRLRRQVQGLINRLSEVKLISILGDVEEIYRENPRADVTGVLTDILVSTLCDPSVLMDTYHILHGGFLAGLYKILGTDVGATVVQRIVEEFIKNHDKVNGIADPSTAGKECTNLISFLSELYNFGVVGCVLIFDFIRMFLSELTELHTELLLKIVRSK